MANGISPVANGNPWAYLGQPDYFEGLMAKLPPGDGYLGPLCAALFGAGGAGGIAQGFADLHAEASQLSEVEMQPSETVQLLSAWERDYGLPDCCSAGATTIAQRQAALCAKIAAQGGQSAAYYESVAAAFGLQITITEGAPGSFTWTVTTPATAPAELFIVGENGMGTSLDVPASNAQAECFLNRIKPAHTILNFATA